MEGDRNFIFTLTKRTDTLVTGSTIKDTNIIGNINKLLKMYTFERFDDYLLEYSAFTRNNNFYED